MAKGSHERPIIVYAAMGANLIIAIAKFVAAAFTGSSAMISEGIHSVADTGNQGLLLLGIQRSRRPPDHIHPFGHAQEIYYWGLIVAMVLFGLGGGMSFYEGIRHLRHPVELTSPTWNYVVLGIALVVEGISWRIAYIELVHKGAGLEGRSILDALRSHTDATIYTVFAEDTAAMAGLVIAFLGIFLGHALSNPYIDGIASLLIGIVLTAVAVFLARESRGLLVGEAADPALLDRIQAIARQDPAVRRAETPLTMQLGPREILVNMHVQFEPGLTAEELGQVTTRLQSTIRAQIPDARYLFIEASSFSDTAPEGEKKETAEHTERE